MIIESAHLFSENQAISAASTQSAIVDLMGTNKTSYVMTWIFVNLTKGFSAGKIDSVKFQTGDSETLSDAFDLQTIGIPTNVDQKSPNVLLQFRIPQGTKRYARLVYAASGSPAGGTVTASTSAGVAINGGVSM